MLFMCFWVVFSCSIFVQKNLKKSKNLETFLKNPVFAALPTPLTGDPEADLWGVTRVTSHPPRPGAVAYFMLLLCVKAIYTFLIMPTS